MNFISLVKVALGLKRGCENQVGLKGEYHIQHFRNGKVLNEFLIPNGVTTVGKNHALDITFDAGSQESNWYIGLIDNSGYSALAAADTMSSHSGWSEFTDVDESNRVEWDPDAAASGSMTNSTARTYNINSSGTLRGAFLCSNNTLGGSTGTLFGTALFTSTIDVINGDDIKVTYTVTG